MSIYNVSKIENWYEDLVSSKNTFNNKYYSDFNRSYIKRCSDGIINGFERNLQVHYDKIKRSYTNIDIYWKDYLNDLRNTDNRLAGKSVSIKEGSILSKISNLPYLDDLKEVLNISKLDTLKVVGTPKAKEWVNDNFTWENLGLALEKAGATVATVAVSLVEGVVKLGEGAVDLLAITGAAISTVVTASLDGINYAISEINDDESLRTDYTSQMWDGTRSFVSENYTKQVFDSIYDSTKAGEWMKEQCLGFDTVRQIGNEIGEVAGVVALAALTGGSAAVFYGAAKSAEHTETNWQDENTSTLKGLIKGATQGTLDGLFFAAGMKGDEVAKAAAKGISKSALEVGNKEALKAASKEVRKILAKKMAYEGGTSVAQDLSTIGIDILFSKDTITDENGNIIKFNNLKDKADYYYEQAGGTTGLIESVITASILSFLSDKGDTTGVFKKMVKNADNASKEAIEKTAKSAVNDIIDELNNTKTVLTDGNNKQVPVPDIERWQEWSDERKVFFSPNPNDSPFKNVDIEKPKVLTNKEEHILAYNELLEMKRRMGDTGVDPVSGRTSYDIDKQIEYEKLYGKAYVNLEREIDNLIEEKKYLEKIGYEVDPRNGTTIFKVNDDLDKTLLKFKFLKDSVYNEGKVFTKQEWDFIEKYKDVQNSPEGILNLKKLYSKEEFNDLVLLYKYCRKVDDFIESGKSKEHFIKAFSKYIDHNKEKIDSINDINIMASKKLFEILNPTKLSNAGGCNNGKINFLNLEYDDDPVWVLSHECIHHLSHNNISGIKLSENYRGINETITEYLNMLSFGSSKPRGYYKITIRIKKLVDENVLTNDDIMKSYFGNNVGPIKTKINQIGGRDDYFDDLVLAFKDAHDNGNLSDLDRLTSELGIKRKEWTIFDDDRKVKFVSKKPQQNIPNVSEIPTSGFSVNELRKKYYVFEGKNVEFTNGDDYLFLAGYYGDGDLQAHLKNIPKEKYDTFLKRHPASPIPNLNAEQFIAIQSYTGASSGSLNSILIKGNYNNASPYMKDMVDNIDRAISTSKLSKDQAFYRGTSLKELGINSYEELNSIIGKDIVNDTWFGSSISKETACEFSDKPNGIIIEHLEQAGSNAIDVSGISTGREGEFLFERGTKRKIIGIRKEVIDNGMGELSERYIVTLANSSLFS